MPGHWGRLCLPIPTGLCLWTGKRLQIFPGTEESRRKGIPGFYYYVLEEKAAEKVRSVLSEEEIQYLRELDHREGDVIFPAEDRLIRIAASLNESEMLFSTFYVVEKDGAASIWWGNYRGEYEKFFPAETGSGSGPVPAECTENP